MNLRRSVTVAVLFALLLASFSTIWPALAASSTSAPQSITLRDDTGWLQRRAIRIDNSQNTVSLANYPVRVVLDNSNFDFARVDSSGADIRFADEDGRTSLQYWLQQYDADQRSAVIWVKVPAIPAAASKTIYLYYGNPVPHALSNGMRVFDFFDDFGVPGTGYYDLSPARTVLTVTQSWEKAAPHTLSVVEANRDGYRYWGYYGLTNCGGIGLARSNDLLHWDKYAQNPLYGSGGERWPSVVKVDGVYYMVHDHDYCTNSFLVLRNSKDGLNFGGDTDYKVLIPAENGVRNQNANLFFDPKSKRFYLYWYRGGDQLGIWQIKVRSAATAEGLSDPSSEQVIIEEPYEIAAPHMLFLDNTYFLATEINENAWKTRIYAGASALGPFYELPGNPILGDNEACFFQHVFSNTLHAYYCKDTGAGWVINYRTADLSSGRSQRRILDVSKWTVPGANWALVSDANERLNGVVLSGTHAAETLIWSSAFTGTDYTFDVTGRIVSGTLWSVGVRADDDRSMYRVDIQSDKTQRLAIARWVGGSATLLAERALDRFNPAEWFTLTIKLHGQTIQAALNGQPYLQATDAQFGAGRVALISPPHESVQFDNVLVRKYAPYEPILTIAQPESQASATGGWFGIAPTPVPVQSPVPSSTQSGPAVTPPADGLHTEGSPTVVLLAGACIVLIVAGLSVWAITRKRRSTDI